MLYHRCGRKNFPTVRDGTTPGAHQQPAPDPFTCPDTCRIVGLHLFEYRYLEKV